LSDIKVFIAVRPRLADLPYRNNEDENEFKQSLYEVID